MRDTEKARPGVTAPGRAETRNANNISSSQYITGKGGVASLLLEGAENALPLRELERLTGLDGRTVRRMIEQERRRGVPILNDCKRGYYLLACDYDTRRFVGQMRSRAREIWKTASAVERGGGDPDQFTIDEGTRRE